MLIHRERLKDLVLVGGGHSHVIALRMFGMNPIDSHQVTLISAQTDTPYSGMLPGLIAGHYGPHETHIDLRRLCQWSGVRFIQAEVIGFDPRAKLLTLHGRPQISYDLVSFDVGARPSLTEVTGASDYAIPVKPISKFWQKWCELKGQKVKPEKIAVVGGGAGSVELIFAMAESLSGEVVQFDLYCGSFRLLPEFSCVFSRAIEHVLKRRGVNVYLNAKVDEVTQSHLILRSSERCEYDHVFWCTSAAPTPWLSDSGLSLDEDGFLATGPTLQSLDDQNVFAVGDCATQVHHKRPKAGVFAVRQGPVLAHNLRAKLLERSLQSYRPQKRFLSILSLGNQFAAASWGPFFLLTRWAWLWKNAIDRRFMSRFMRLPSEVMSNKSAVDDSRKKLQPHCGGCGAKISPNVLSNTLSTLAELYPQHCIISLDDSREIVFSNKTVWQSIDALREIVTDPWQMGQLAANHALSDLYACGLKPHSVQALITIPFASSSIQARELMQILEGALTALRKSDCILAGGHSMQGAELQIAFSVNGHSPAFPTNLLSKRGLCYGDRLLVTRPLGSGVLFAAHMQLLANGLDLENALSIMIQSNYHAAKLCLENGVKCATDVTGFGLAVHMLEMLQASQGAIININDLPSFDGVLPCLAKGVRSTSHDANREFASGSMIGLDGAGLEAELLFDPQTCGGMLVGVAPKELEKLSNALSSEGIGSYVIGEVTGRQGFIDLCY